MASSKTKSSIMNISKFDFFGCLLAFVIILHLIVAPYTKVEESFNLQATHDLLTNGIPLRNISRQLAINYDHISFPGSVPRTFVGAILLSAACWPFTFIVQNSKAMQMIVRGVLGLTNAGSLFFFQHAVGQAFGKAAQCWYILFQCSQFHIMYYASRTLPNMMAFSLSNVAVGSLLLSRFGPRIRRVRRIRTALWCLIAAGIIFRSELALLLATQTSVLVFLRHHSIRHLIIPTGIVASIFALFVTLTVDSFFWREFPLWPELVAFRFNAIEGKSSSWGTSPWHFYFTNSLPRLVMNPGSFFFYIPVALWHRSVRSISLEILGPLVAYIAALSFLPHKEWRFIVYTIPGITAVAAVGASIIWTRKSRSNLMKFLAMTLVVSTIFSLCSSIGLLLVSSMNYPGAVALERLHSIAHGEKAVLKVHMDNLSCQTGITRFLEKTLPLLRQPFRPNTVWYHDKSNDQDQYLNSSFWKNFDYVLAENPNEALGAWEVVENVTGFAGFSLAAEKSQVKDFKSAINGPNNQLNGLDYLKTSGILYYLKSLARKYLINKYWPVIKMSNKISILKNLNNN